jgi:hypothetical protein
MLRALAGLESGTGYFWSPHWMKVFDKVRVRQRETFHPGATREQGKAIKSATMSNVADFVSKLQTRLAKPSASAAPSGQPTGLKLPSAQVPDEIETLRTRNHDLSAELREAKTRLDRVRKALQPQYDALRGLFEDLKTGIGRGADRSVYEPWLVKAGKTGARRMLELLIEHGELSKDQLRTLSGVASSTFRAGMAFLRRNGLCASEGDQVRLKQL